MLDDFLKDQAALYVCGAMPAAEREQFELVLEFHDELRALVTELQEIGVSVLLETPATMEFRTSPALRQRLQGIIATHPQQNTPDGMVVTGPDGLVRWISPAFTALCGYSLEEVQGKKLGPILQGERTDRQVAERMSLAVRELRPCRETILNYHKDGTPYWVDIAITPIFDDANQPRWLVGRERQVAGPAEA